MRHLVSELRVGAALRQRHSESTAQCIQLQHTAQPSTFVTQGYGASVSTSIQHEKPIEGLYVAESWIVESEQDKSRKYGLEVPIGTWMVAVKVENEDVWKKIKAEEVKGFSIEAYFVNKIKAQEKDELQDIVNIAKNLNFDE